MLMYGVILCWVCEHSIVEGTEVANELAIQGFSMHIGDTDSSIRPLISKFLSLIKNGVFVIQRMQGAKGKLFH